MAGLADQVKEQVNIERQARRLAELFRGRFNSTVAEQIIRDKGGEREALDFVLNGDEEEVQQFLNQNEEYLAALREDSRNVATLLENGIDYTDRQFSCGDCEKSWWKRVPQRKEVSKCYRCHVKYDPVPRDKEWGWGQFYCECGHEFKGFGIMERTISKCYECKGPVPIHHIFPPKKKTGPPIRTPTRNPHNCNGVNCMRQNVFAHFYKPCECIHPRSEDLPSATGGIRIHYASSRHISTGSTVDSCLSQGSLDDDERSIAHSLATLHEHPNYRGGRGGGGRGRGGRGRGGAYNAGPGQFGPGMFGNHLHY